MPKTILELPVRIEFEGTASTEELIEWLKDGALVVEMDLESNGVPEGAEWQSTNADWDRLAEVRD